MIKLPIVNNNSSDVNNEINFFMLLIFLVFSLLSLFDIRMYYFVFVIRKYYVTIVLHYDGCFCLPLLAEGEGLYPFYLSHGHVGRCFIISQAMHPSDRIDRSPPIISMCQSYAPICPWMETPKNPKGIFKSRPHPHQKKSTFLLRLLLLYGDIAQTLLIFNSYI